ncbi:hypothetical protein NHX12_031304 [Muraenolepis orangiensis]|uniref:Uncharacterized protein n=1 Tax=Muraenolepis orangiensis TaxID=630683 RepID=A0A9Q0E3G6_9TELE|nr:hypothetical protein NHX12_031304 [Muraenolepis orangiensis]
MSQKLALFNNLSQPGGGSTSSSSSLGGRPAPPERRRQKGARYRTQPITVEEVSLLQKGPIQLPAFCLAPHLSDRQQALSVNLKPSELRLSTPDMAPGGPAEPLAARPLPRSESEPAIRGILKKKSGCSSAGAASRPDPAELPARTGTASATTEDAESTICRSVAPEGSRRRSSRENPRGPSGPPSGGDEAAGGDRFLPEQDEEEQGSSGRTTAPRGQVGVTLTEDGALMQQQPELPTDTQTTNVCPKSTNSVLINGITGAIIFSHDQWTGGWERVYFSSDDTRYRIS